MSETPGLAAGGCTDFLDDFVTFLFDLSSLSPRPE
jgi:hypothetical protein